MRAPGIGAPNTGRVACNVRPRPAFGFRDRGSNQRHLEQGTGDRRAAHPAQCKNQPIQSWQRRARRVLRVLWASVQVGLGLKDMLLQHMLRFKYSVIGALQWKRDMAEYQAAAARFKVQRVADGFEQARPCPCANPPPRLPLSPPAPSHSPLFPFCLYTCRVHAAQQCLRVSCCAVAYPYAVKRVAVPRPHDRSY